MKKRWYSIGLLFCLWAEEQTYWVSSLFHLAHKNLPCQFFAKNNLSSNNKQASIISPAPSLFLSPLFSLIYLQSRIIRGVGKEHRKIFMLEPAGVKASKFLRCLYSPWGETPQHKENHPDITKDFHTERKNKPVYECLAMEHEYTWCSERANVKSDWCRAHKRMHTGNISHPLNKQH